MAAGTSPPVRLYAGTYDKGGGDGLVALRYSAERGWTIDGRCASVRNASFGVYSPQFDLHYLVDEQQEGAVGAYREAASGLTQVARLATRGADPCYVSLDPTGRWLAVANYGSGSIALVSLDAGTGLFDRVTVQQDHGSGPVAGRQEGPHAHCALFDPAGDWFYHVDLGADRVIAQPFDPAHGLRGEPITAYRAPPGAGPRHLLFHPHRPIALLICELAATLTVLDVADGRLSERRTVPTAPPDYAGENTGGHLALDAAANRVYVTNRGHDSIAVFTLDQTGELTLLQHTPSRGASPRFFLLLEAARLLVVANQEGGNVTAFRIEPDGRLSAIPGSLPLPGVAFLMPARTPASADEK